MCVILGDLQEISFLRYPIVEMKIRFFSLNDALRLNRRYARNAIALFVPFMDEFVGHVGRQGQ